MNRLPVLIISVALLFAVAAPPYSSAQDPEPGPFDVQVEKDIMVSMTDGIRLATDVYRPKGVDGPLPVLMTRLPYDKNTYGEVKRSAPFYAGHGYAVVVQDVRGKHGSEGDYHIYNGDIRDYYDAIEWVSKQSWSNGKVGTFGCSYLGETQIIAASTRHPAHVAMIPHAAGGAAGSTGGHYSYFGSVEGGAVALSINFGWMSEVASTSRGFTPVPKGDFAMLQRQLPAIDILQDAGNPSWDWNNFFTRDLTDPYWSELGYIEPDDSFDTPSLHVSSWFDLAAEQLTLFNQMSRRSGSARARGNQFAIISPTTHCATGAASEHTMVGDLDVGDARIDLRELSLRWFDYWLKGEKNGVLEMPKLRLYVIGRGIWREENEWPLARTRFTPLYLDSGGHANSRGGDGVLSFDKPHGGQIDTYTYDPANPVPSRGGSICCTGNPKDQPGSYDHSDIEDRKDVLVYTSAPLESGLESTGPLEALLYVSSSAKDTDFTVKLLDVFPDGRAFNIQEGILRARYREGFGKKVWMEPGDVYEVGVSLNATSWYWRPGHRIRVEVSSSSFPRWDRNLNTGGNNYDEKSWVTARNTIHHTEQYPSHILLPVIPDR